MGNVERWAFVHGSLLYPLALILDRILFFLIFRRLYKKRFLDYGCNVRWGRNGAYYCIPRSVRISGAHLIAIGSNTQIDDGVYLQCHLDGDGIKIGDGCRINAHTHIQSFSRIILEEDVLVAPFSHISSSNHRFEAGSDLPILKLGACPSGAVRIGTGTWIGRGAHVLGGVELGRNCVVAAGAVVTKCAQPELVLAGVPARPLPRKTGRRTPASQGS